MKLLSVERSITIFHRKSEELVNEIIIPDNVDAIKQVVKQRKNDELFYLEYRLKKTQITKLLKIINISLFIELKTYSYYLSCTGNYDWNNK